jgi:hypothetical protein
MSNSDQNDKFQVGDTVFFKGIIYDSDGSAQKNVGYIMEIIYASPKKSKKKKEKLYVVGVGVFGEQSYLCHESEIELCPPENRIDNERFNPNLPQDYRVYRSLIAMEHRGH